MGIECGEWISFCNKDIQTHKKVVDFSIRCTAVSHPNGGQYRWCAVAYELHIAPRVHHSFCASPKDIINCPQKEFSFLFVRIWSICKHTYSELHSVHMHCTHKNSNVNANANTIGNIKLFMFHLMSRLCLISRSLYRMVCVSVWVRAHMCIMCG